MQNWWRVGRSTASNEEERLTCADIYHNAMRIGSHETCSVRLRVLVEASTPESPQVSEIEILYLGGAQEQRRRGQNIFEGGDEGKTEGLCEM